MSFVLFFVRFLCKVGMHDNGYWPTLSIIAFGFFFFASSFLDALNFVLFPLIDMSASTLGMAPPFCFLSLVFCSLGCLFFCKVPLCKTQQVCISLVLHSCSLNSLFSFAKFTPPLLLLAGYIFSFYSLIPFFIVFRKKIMSVTKAHPPRREVMLP